MTNDGGKGNVNHFKITWTRRASSRRRVGLHSSKNGRCSEITEQKQNRNVQTYGYVHHDTNGLNHGPGWKIESFLLSEICTVILWQDCYEKGNLGKSY